MHRILLLLIRTAAPVKMEMTAPVPQAAVMGGMQVQFVLPAGVVHAP